MKKSIYHNLTFVIGIAIILGLGSSTNNYQTQSSLISIQNDILRNSNPKNIIHQRSMNIKGSFNLEIVGQSFEPIWNKLLPSIRPSARYHSAMAYDSINKKTLLFGGFNGSSLSDTWSYDYSTNTWENMNPAISPNPMFGHAMVFDSAIQKVVLFGGGETWTYDYPTNTWEQQFPTVSPSTRQHHSMIYDTNQQKVIMIGGTSATFETWELNTSTFEWSNRMPSGTVQRLFAFGAAYDETDRKIIIFGGQNETARLINQGDTYSYDYLSNTWTQLFPTDSPSNRRFYGKGMAYDPFERKILFYGGTEDPGPTSETWVFDFTQNNWQLLYTSNTPPPNWAHTMIFDRQEKKFIMFGGLSPTLNDETFELNAFDTDPPTIISPGDTYLELGNQTTSISWQVFDPSDGSYQITLDDQIIDFGNFSDGQILSIIPIGLDLGNYTFKILATDSNGYSSSDTIILYVVESKPPIIIGPEDLEIGLFEINKNITWVLQDLTPSRYNITQNGTLIDEGDWANGDKIIIDLDFLPLGTHIFEIVVIDAFGNFAIDNVTVRIIDFGIPTISHPDDIFTTEGTVGKRIIWSVDDDNPTNYTLEQNGVIIANDTYLNLFFVEVNLDGYAQGAYNFTLTLFDEDNHMVSDYVEVQIFPSAGTGVQGGSGSPRGGGGNFIDVIDPQIAVGVGAFVAVFGGAYFVLRRR